MAEVVANTGVSKDKGYLYYLGKDGNVWRSQMARAGKGGGDIKEFQNAFDKFKKDVSRLDLGEAGQINAEMLLLFKDLRRIEAQELYTIAHNKIGFKSMDLTDIKNAVEVSPKVIVPTLEKEKIAGVQSAADWDDGAFNIIKEQLAILGKNNTLVT